LTLDPESEIRRVCDFVRLPFEPAMLDLRARSRGIVTASAVQVRDRIHTQETPKWAAYADQLAPLRQRLGQVG
jgi:hypothetical protein